MTTCCVLGCYDQGKFSLPFDNPAIYNKWLISCPYLKSSHGRELENKRICSKHFIPEHLQIFPNHFKDRLTKDAVPLLNLPKYLNDECQEVKEEEDDEGIQTIEDLIDPSLFSTSVSDESLHYDSMECIPFQPPEKTENDPLKSSPVDFDDDQVSMRLALSPDPDDVVMTMPRTEHKESPPIIKPKPIKVLKVVLHQLPSILHMGKKFKISSMPPSLVPKPKSAQIAPKILNHIGLSSPPALVPPPRLPILVKKTPILKTNQNNSQNQSKLSLEREKKLTSSIRKKPISLLKINYNELPPELFPEKDHGSSNTIGKKVSGPLIKTNNRADDGQTVVRTPTYKPGMNCPKMKSYLAKEQDSLSRFGLTFTMDTNNVRYTTKEKIFALSVMKLCPKLIVNYLKKEIIPLPTKEMINIILNHVPLRPGINQFIFQHLADAASHKFHRYNECVLLFRETDIVEYLHFNAETGIIEGYQDLGSGKRANVVGNKVLVFMLCGLFQHWKVPIAYYITGNLIEKNIEILKIILTEVLKAVFDTGFVVKATISDHNSTIDEAIKSLTIDTGLSENKIYYAIGNQRIYHIFDVTNILECLKKDSKGALDLDFLKTLFLIHNVETGDETEKKQLKATEAKNTGADPLWSWNKPTDEVEFWGTALTRLQAMKLKVQDENPEHLPLVNIIINNVKSIKTLCEDSQPRITPILRLDLTALDLFLSKIQKPEQKIKSSQFINKYISLLINTLTSDKSLCTGFATYHSSKYDDKILGLLKSFVNPKKYGPYYDDVDLENVVYYVEKLPTKGGKLQAFKTILDSYIPFKDCGMCLNSITIGFGMDIAISKSEKIINEIIPAIVNNNCQMYHLSLILQQRVNSSWFICELHKGLFFKIFWAFLIKIEATKWCSYFNLKNNISN